MFNTVVTNHAEKRIRERMGLSKNITDKIAWRALQQGVTHVETTGNLHKYMDHLYLQHGKANNPRIYNSKVFLFHEDILITVIDLPSRYSKIVEKIKSRRVES